MWRQQDSGHRHPEFLRIGLGVLDNVLHAFVRTVLGNDKSKWFGGGEGDPGKVLPTVDSLSGGIEVGGDGAGEVPQQDRVAVGLGRCKFGHSHLGAGTGLVHHLNGNSHFLLEQGSNDSCVSVRSSASIVWHNDGKNSSLLRVIDLV